LSRFGFAALWTAAQPRSRKREIRPPRGS
jgi:hypothetical protein